MSSDTREKKNRKKILPIVLASVAVVGVGAALTSAAWTDEVGFLASAKAGTFNLQGRIAGETVWAEGSEAAKITFDAEELANLSPGDERILEFELQNAGTVGATIETVEVTPAGALFAGEAPTVTFKVTGITPGSTIDPTKTTAGALTVTVPDGWPSSHMGESGSITVTFTGESVSD